jgi:hypothetical protein
MTNQPTKSVKRPYPSNLTFQERLLEVTKVFWKAGFVYGRSGDNDLFYSNMLQDLMEMPEDEFMQKYQYLQ